MSALAIAALSGFVSGGVAYTLGWLVHRKPPDVAAYLAPVVGTAEELAARERRLRRQIFDADRTALPNPEPGQPARVTRAHASRLRTSPS